jgi:hypothetical protein
MVDEAGQPARRRRRRQATRVQGAPPPADPVPPEPDEVGPAAPTQQPRRKRAPRDAGERGLRDLIGAGHSQVGVSGALRARDVNRPTADDLAEAEQELVIVRRNWRPDDSPKKPGQ